MKTLTDKTLENIIDTAMKMFLEKSISEVKMSDIARHSDVGEASLYRYFSTKQNLVLKACVRVSKQIIAEYFQPEPKESGYEQIEDFYKIYEQVFCYHPEYFKFISQVEAYLITQKKKDLKEYEEVINLYKVFFIDAYRMGLKDQTVVPQEDVEGFYYSTTHSLLNLCKFLAGDKLLSQDELIDKNKEITIITKLILEKLKA